jgi:ribosome maturation factor RimP
MDAALKTLVEQMLAPVLVQESLELVDIEYVQEAGNWYLRVFVDQEGGIDLDAVSRVSEHLSQQMDIHDPIVNAYILEVSSPGAERPLKRPRDFERALNKYVYVNTYAPVDGIKELEGTLVHYDGEGLIIESKKVRWEVPMSAVAQARLAIRF